jgi:hypothetical protein
MVIRVLITSKGMQITLARWKDAVTFDSFVVLKQKNMDKNI